MCNNGLKKTYFTGNQNLSTMPVKFRGSKKQKHANP